MKYTYNVGCLREKVTNKKIKDTYGINVDELFYTNIIKYIDKNNKKTIKALDIGTGTGIVPRQIYNKINLNNKNIKIDAIDTSQDLIKIAKSKDKKTNYFSDKANIQNSNYDVITNRLCPNFKVSTVSSSIKKDGVYIFKEYGSFRGMKEIKNLFKDTWVSGKNSTYFISKLNQQGFNYITCQKFLYQRKYTIEDIDLILKSTNLLKTYTKKDYNLIKHVLGTEFLITQDPYIIIASKSKNIFL